jgi:hypothetical protein
MNNNNVNKNYVIIAIIGDTWRRYELLRYGAQMEIDEGCVLEIVTQPMSRDDAIEEIGELWNP